MEEQKLHDSVETENELWNKFYHSKTRTTKEVRVLSLIQALQKEQKGHSNGSVGFIGTETSKIDIIFPLMFGTDYIRLKEKSLIILGNLNTDAETKQKEETEAITNFLIQLVALYGEQETLKEQIVIHQGFEMESLDSLLTANEMHLSKFRMFAFDSSITKEQYNLVFPHVTPNVIIIIVGKRSPEWKASHFSSSFLLFACIDNYCFLCHEDYVDYFNEIWASSSS